MCFIHDHPIRQSCVGSLVEIWILARRKEELKANASSIIKMCLFGDVEHTEL